MQFVIIKVLLVLFAIFTPGVLASAYRRRRYHDQVASPSSCDRQKKVEIKVYREPLREEGGQGYAPWGYYSRQPSDAYA